MSMTPDDQQATEWAKATEQFLTSEAGQNWPGGSNNLTLMGYLLRVNGLADAEDKVSALKAVANEMHERGLDISPEKKIVISANDSPAEILLKWKFAYSDDPVKVGE